MQCYRGYTDEESKIIKKLEKKFISITTNYRLREWEIPALISGDILKKCGYFKTMPNQLTVVGNIDKHAIANVIDENLVRREDIDNKNYYLTPAACIHLYPMIEKNHIYNEVITTRARVYRYEDGEFENDKRLWDFGVREFVGVGTKDFVNDFLLHFEKESLSFAKSLGLSCHIADSNDHFYPTKSNNTMKKIQKVNGLKKELICDSENLAIASFNYHGTHFSKIFNFDKDSKIVTGCVGFGLDRWVYMLKK